MLHRLPYGTSSALQLDIPAGVLVDDYPQAAAKGIDDPAQAVASALAGPEKFPPLHQAVVPGDQVVIALDPDVPQASQVVAGAVRALLDAHVAADDITLLQADRPGSVAGLSAQLPPEAQPVHVITHDPDDRAELAYLAAAKDASPIVLNRHLCDADLVLPISLVRPDTSFIYSGPHGGLCPTFADAATRQRFRTPNSTTSRKQLRLRREEANEVAWLLGVQLSLQVIAGSGNSLLHVLAGQASDITERGQQLAQQVWGYHRSEKADLVVATMEGTQDNSTWENFGRALYAAQQLCDTEGTIILCTDLSCRPGTALQKLARTEDRDELLQRLGNERTEDALAAWLLADARDRFHIFLLSQLDEAAVESWGVGPVSTAEQVSRISSRANSCILLANAHRGALLPGA